MITTTLKAIKAHGPCKEGWLKLVKALGGVRKYGLTTPLPLLTILESNGLSDALWALRAVQGNDKEVWLLSCDFAEHALRYFEDKYPDDKRPRIAIEVARRFIEGTATLDDLIQARSAAYLAAHAAQADASASAYTASAATAHAYASAYAAAYTAYTASAAHAYASASAANAAAAASASERLWQTEKFKEFVS